MSDSAPARSQHSLRGRVVSHGESPASSGNLANLITLVRILIAPAVVWMLLVDGGELGVLRWLAAGLFILAIATDSVDGSLARQRNLVTPLGKLLDPIADKVLIGGALVALSILAELPWWVTIVILVRELGITVYRFFKLRDRVIPADWAGKLKTIVQAIAISFGLVPLWLLIGDWIWWVNAALMSVAVALTLWSGFRYLWAARTAPTATEQ